MSDERQESSLRNLGHYEIIRRIGQGGMGDVYLANDGTLDRTVAIKVLPPEFSREQDFIRRFQAEASAAARLTHPNIVQIHAIGEEDGRHYFVMQHVVGRSLSDRLNDVRSLPVNETLDIIEQVVSGLAAAHRNGLIHRDIKPGNVLLDEEHGRALLADFGLVKSVDAIADNTATGVILGTVDYMSPEQGRGKKVDQRSDLYSVGVMLYRMLAGRLPFEADSPTAMIFQHAYESPPDLHDIAPEHPREVSLLVAKLMAKEPGERHQSADELLLALRSLRRTLGLLDASQIIAAPGTRTAADADGTEDRWGRRLPLLDRLRLLLKRQAPALADHLLNTQQQVDVAISDYEERCLQLECLVADAEFVFEDLNKQAKEQRQAATKWRQQGDAEQDESERQIAFQEQRYCEEIAADLEAQTALQQNELESIRLQLAQTKGKLVKLTNQRDLLAARLRAAQGVIDAPPKNLLTLPRLLAAVSVTAILWTAYLIWFQPDEPREEKDWNKLSDSSNDGEMVRGPTVDPMHSSRGADFPLVDLNFGRATALAISPDRINGLVRFAVAGADASARDVSLNPKTPDRAAFSRHNIHLKRIYDLAYSPDGRWLASASEDGTIQVHDETSHRVIRTIPLKAMSLKFSRDGQRLWIGARGAVHVWDVLLDKELQRLDLGVRYGNVATMDWLEEDSVILLGTLIEGGPSTGLWNMNQERPLMVFQDVKTSVEDAYIVSQGAEAIIRTRTRARLRSLTDGSLKREYGTRGAFATAITPDRLRLIVGNAYGYIEVWDLQADKLVERVRVFEEEIEHLGVYPDGNWIVAVGKSGKIAVKKIAEHVPHGQLHLFHEIRSQPLRQIRVSPNGLRVASANERNVQQWNLDFPRRGQIVVSRELRNAVMAYSLDGRRMAIASGPDRGNNQIEIHTLEIGVIESELRRFSAHDEAVTQLRYSPNGRYVLSSSRDGTVVGWDGVSEEMVFKLDVGSVVNDFAVTTKNRLVTADADYRVRIWDFSKEMEIGSLDEGHTFVVTSVDCSRDGTLAISGGADRRLIVWDLENLTKKFELTGHSGGVTSAVLSRDGTKILSGCQDGVVRLWSVTERRLVREYHGHVGVVTSVDIEPDGERGLSAGEDGTLRIWDLSSE